MADLVRGEDGLARCRWAVGVPIYESYHDEEWGRPVHGDEALFERITLEAFQSGLSCSPNYATLRARGRSIV